MKCSKRINEIHQRSCVCAGALVSACLATDLIFFSPQHWSICERANCKQKKKAVRVMNYLADHVCVLHVLMLRCEPGEGKALFCVWDFSQGVCKDVYGACHPQVRRNETITVCFQGPHVTPARWSCVGNIESRAETHLVAQSMSCIPTGALPGNKKKGSFFFFPTLIWSDSCQSSKLRLVSWHSSLPFPTIDSELFLRWFSVKW